jgi:UDP-N-acetylglucosamine 1-carboxyvinyltransferase
MSRFVVQGGHPIRGEITPTGNKNAALPMLAACLLTDQPVILRRVPDIQDVRVLCTILSELGVEISRDRDVVTLTAGTVNPDRLSP